MRKLTRTLGKGEVVSSILTGSTRYSRNKCIFDLPTSARYFRHGTKHEGDVQLVRNPRGLIGVCSLRAIKPGENAGPISRMYSEICSAIRPRRWCRSASAQRGSQ